MARFTSTHGLGAVRIAGAHWDDVDRSVVAWAGVAAQGDGSIARQPVDGTRGLKPGAQRLAKFATALRAQGLDDEADRFTYRAQVLQRQVFWPRGQRLRWFGSWLLDFAAGCGYRPLRSAVAYVPIILGFVALYVLNGRFATPHLRWDEALVLSVSSFHGRGFFTSSVTLGDTLARLAARLLGAALCRLGSADESTINAGRCAPVERTIAVEATVVGGECLVVPFAVVEHVALVVPGVAGVSGSRVIPARRRPVPPQAAGGCGARACVAPGSSQGGVEGERPFEGGERLFVSIESVERSAFVVSDFCLLCVERQRTVIGLCVRVSLPALTPVHYPVTTRWSYTRQ